MDKFITFVGLDVHKDSIVIAVAESGGSREVRRYGKVGGDLGSLDKAVRRLVSAGSELCFAYEAGPCGYEIYRHLTKLGYECIVVAPSMIPKKSGDRIKTDHRDAEALARLYRAGELTAVSVPSEDHEAMRDLTRCREDAIKSQRSARQQLGAFLLRHGIRFEGRASWSKAHVNWLSDIRMPTPPQQIALQEYIGSVKEGTERVARLSEQVLALMSDWDSAHLTDSFQALRGVAPIVAATVVAEVGGLGRFDNPRQLMAYLGLVPSEHSSGGSIRRGGITKTGNGHARKALIEAAQAYCFPARVSRVILRRQERLSEAVKDIAWKAQLRLCGKFRRLLAKGKNRNTVVAAIARELAGFLWAIDREVNTRPRTA